MVLLTLNVWLRWFCFGLCASTLRLHLHYRSWRQILTECRSVPLDDSHIGRYQILKWMWPKMDVRASDSMCFVTTYCISEMCHMWAVGSLWELDQQYLSMLYPRTKRKNYTFLTIKQGDLVCKSGSHSFSPSSLHLYVHVCFCRSSLATTCPASWLQRTSAYGRTCCPTSAIPATSPDTTPASSRRRATAAGTGAWRAATKPPSTPPTPESNIQYRAPKPTAPSLTPSLPRSLREYYRTLKTHLPGWLLL